MKQVELDFEGGLTDQFPEWQDMVVESVYGSGKAFKVIASDMDMSSSELSRKINFNPDDNVDFPLRRFAELVMTTEDFRPIYWLIEKFIEDSEKKKSTAINTLVKLMPEIERALREVGNGS